MLGTDDSRADPMDRPLSSLLMHIATFDTSTGVTQHLVQVEAQVKAETLVQPLLVLTHARPDAWPPRERPASRLLVRPPGRAEGAGRGPAAWRRSPSTSSTYVPGFRRFELQAAVRRFDAAP